MSRDLGGLRFSAAVPISAGQSLSAAFNVNNGTVVGVFTPDGWTAASITFETALDEGDTFVPVLDATGEPVTIVATENNYYALPMTALNGLENLKVRSGTFASPVTQDEAVSLVIVFRSVT